MTTANETQNSRCGKEVSKAYESRLFSPNVDIYETANSVVLVADLPGVDQDELDITLEKNTLTIRGRSQEREEESDFNALYSEYAVGDFERSFTVSDEIERDGIEANLKNGVLKLTLPKAKESRPRKIDVQAV